MNDSPFFDPNYLNLEYIYTRVYQWWITLNLEEFSFGLSGKLTFWFSVIVYSISILLGLAATFLLLKLRHLRHSEVEKLNDAFEASVKSAKVKNEEWEKSLKLLESDNPSDWKLAIITADSLLDKLVQILNYPGENLGERLKNAELSDFTTLQDAWEAHKVRNRIAHEPNFPITKREARRVLGLFENVFHEFDYI